MSFPSCSQVTSKAGLELVGMIILLIPIGYIYVFSSHFQPFQRGFFCDDKSIKHPYKEETVSFVQAVLIWASLSIVLILLVETLRTYAEHGKRRSHPIPGRTRVPWIATELYRQFGYFALGGIGCLLFTEISKYTIGRLRPHFLTICKPEMTPQLCNSPFGFYRYVTESEKEICQGLDVNGGNTTAKQMHEARLSFMSGHAAFSFYCAGFLFFFLQARLSNFPSCSVKWVSYTYRTLKVLRPFIQFSLIVLAFWIALTRISDYFHHPEDVLTGAIVGLSFAGVTLLVIADIFNRKSSFWKTLTERRDEPLGEETKSNVIEDLNKSVEIKL